MNNRVLATWKTFAKMMLYQALLVVATELQTAGSWDLINWRLITTAAVLAALKAALTYITTEAEK